MAIKSILLTTNVGADGGNPLFRNGSITTYLLPLVDRIKSDAPDIDVRLLISEASYLSLMRDPSFHIRKIANILTINASKIFPDKGFGDGVLAGLYNGNLSIDDMSCLMEAYRIALGDFSPDAIISWEFPISHLQKMFPDAAALNLMPGTFMRPPFPKMVAVDPRGIYKHSGLQDLLDGTIAPTAEELAAAHELRRHYLSFFDLVNAQEHVLALAGAERKFDSYCLLPLQVGNYFGYQENTVHKSQFDLRARLIMG